MDQSIVRWIPDLALALALAWGAGIRVYAVLFLTGLAGVLGWVELPAHLTALTHPLAIAASGFMAFSEFFADKIPWLDSVWDAIHTFIRIPAGAALAAAVFSDSGTGVAAATAILGGAVAAGSHFTKAGTRGAVNASPEPFSNWALSFTEDALVPAGLWLAVTHPWAFLASLVLAVALVLMLLRWIVNGIAAAARRSGRPASSPPAAPAGR